MVNDQRSALQHSHQEGGENAQEDITHPSTPGQLSTRECGESELHVLLRALTFHKASVTGAGRSTHSLVKRGMLYVPVAAHVRRPCGLERVETRAVGCSALRLILLLSFTAAVE